MSTTLHPTYLIIPLLTPKAGDHEERLSKDIPKFLQTINQVPTNLTLPTPALTEEFMPTEIGGDVTHISLPSS
jgi:hypothetical protein